jgi:hypothetical protein
MLSFLISRNHMRVVTSTVPQHRRFSYLHCRPRTTTPIASNCCLAPVLARAAVGKALLNCIGLKRYRFSTVSIFIVLFSAFFSLVRLQFFQMLHHRPLLFGFNKFTFTNEPASSNTFRKNIRKRSTKTTVKHPLFCPANKQETQGPRTNMGHQSPQRHQQKVLQKFANHAKRICPQ